MCLHSFVAINMQTSKNPSITFIMKFFTFWFVIACLWWQYAIACFIAVKNMVIFRKTMSRVDVKYFSKKLYNGLTLPLQANGGIGASWLNGIYADIGNMKHVDMFHVHCRILSCRMTIESLSLGANWLIKPNAYITHYSRVLIRDILFTWWLCNNAFPFRFSTEYLFLYGLSIVFMAQLPKYIINSERGGKLICNKFIVSDKCKFLVSLQSR